LRKIRISGKIKKKDLRPFALKGVFRKKRYAAVTGRRMVRAEMTKSLEFHHFRTLTNAQ